MEIWGRVTNEQGEPVKDAVVLILEASTSYPDIAALTDESGQYRLSGLSPGTYKVAVNAEGRETSTAEARLVREKSVGLIFRLARQL